MSAGLQDLCCTVVSSTVQEIFKVQAANLGCCRRPHCRTGGSGSQMQCRTKCAAPTWMSTSSRSFPSSCGPTASWVRCNLNCSMNTSAAVFSCHPRARPHCIRGSALQMRCSQARGALAAMRPSIDCPACILSTVTVACAVSREHCSLAVLAHGVLHAAMLPTFMFHCRRRCQGC